MSETCLLAESAGAKVVGILTATRPKPDPATFIGKGKIEELKGLIAENDVSVVIVNHAITPVQERNLEKELECRVLDRTRLILDIFAQRAQSHEGKLQVELAQLKHLSTRLVRGWSHLERQKGGIGLRGPGETQLETDRRLISKRIRSLTKRLEGVEKQRKLRRRSRDKVPVPVVTLVGYTNAGKSTLFNRLVDESIYVADQLFATLDPTMRRLKIKHFGDIVLSDTVGFIQDLPHTLVAAFHSTLEEVKNSSILLHIIDRSNPEYRSHIDEVNLVLKEIGAENIPLIHVYNKIDLIDEKPAVVNDEQGRAVFLSAQKNWGLDLLNETLHDLLIKDHGIYDLSLDVSQERLRSRIRDRCEVISETFDDTGTAQLRLQLSPKDLGWLQKKDGLELHQVST